MSFVATLLSLDEVMGQDDLLLPARPLLDQGTYADLVAFRNQVEQGVRAGAPIYRCPVCLGPVVVRCLRRDKSEPRLSASFHFRHAQHNRQCPLSKEHGWSHDAIRAAKYHGQREGEHHRRLKLLIHDSLSADPRFTNVAMERTWRLEGEPLRWRRPDVSACYGDQQLAFEIQLSTTFVDVMAARRNFYREAGALLVWVVARFDAHWAALAEEDIFYPNNQNIFVADDETLAVSKARSQFVMRAHWHEPLDRGDEYTVLIRDQLVEFGQLTPNIPKQQLYFVDVAQRQADLAAAAKDPLRLRFERHYFAPSVGQGRELLARRAEWHELRHELKRRGVMIPEHLHDLQPLLKSIYSARDAHRGLVGWKFRNLVELTHYLYDRHRELLWPFRQALKAFHRGPIIKSQDPEDRLAPKRKAFHAAIASGDAAFAMPNYVPGLVSILFPTLASHLAMSPEVVLDEESKRIVPCSPGPSVQR